ncbi:MAG: hypothetical protein IPF54_26380 [Draconibacterium sp.]|nr:hypothetical protein [Draconibacterium sp.]
MGEDAKYLTDGGNRKSGIVQCLQTLKMPIPVKVKKEVSELKYLEMMRTS